MNILINEKEITPVQAAKSVFASVIEDVYDNFEDYARLYIHNYDELNEEEITSIYQKRDKIYDLINKALTKDKLV